MGFGRRASQGSRRLCGAAGDAKIFSPQRKRGNTEGTEAGDSQSRPYRLGFGGLPPTPPSRIHTLSIHSPKTRENDGQNTGKLWAKKGQIAYLSGLAPGNQPPVKRRPLSFARLIAL